LLSFKTFKPFNRFAPFKTLSIPFAVIPDRYHPSEAAAGAGNDGDLFGDGQGSFNARDTKSPLAPFFNEG